MISLIINMGYSFTDSYRLIRDQFEHGETSQKKRPVVSSGRHRRPLHGGVVAKLKAHVYRGFLIDDGDCFKLGSCIKISSCSRHHLLCKFKAVFIRIKMPRLSSSSIRSEYDTLNHALIFDDASSQADPREPDHGCS